MTAREVYAKSDIFGDVAEVCWAMNTLSKSKKIIPHGRKPSPHGGPDRVAYRVATPEERTASATKHPAHQLAEPPDDVSTPSPAAPAPAQKPTPRPPWSMRASGTAPREDRPTPTKPPYQAVIEERAAESPPNRAAASPPRLALSIDADGRLTMNGQHFSPIETAQLGRFLAGTRELWEVPF